MTSYLHFQKIAYTLAILFYLFLLGYLYVSYLHEYNTDCFGYFLYLYLFSSSPMGHMASTKCLLFYIIDVSVTIFLTGWGYWPYATPTHCLIKFSFWVVLPIDDCIHPAHKFHLPGFSFRVISVSLLLSQVIHKVVELFNP